MQTDWNIYKKYNILSDLTFDYFSKRLDAMLGCISTLPVNSFRTVRFWMFFNLSSTHQVCIYLILNTTKAVYCEIFLQFKITDFYLRNRNVIYSCDQRWIFIIITPVFVTWSFRNHSHMLISCSRNLFTYLYIIIIIIIISNSWVFFSGFFDE